MNIRILSLFLSFFIICNSQSQVISGQWYGWGNINYLYDESNYMIGLDIIESDEKVNGTMTLYYMNEKLSIPIIGLYERKSKTIFVSEVLIPMHFNYLRPLEKLQIPMYLKSQVINSKSGDKIRGNLVSSKYHFINNINFVLVKPYDEIQAVTNPLTSVIENQKIVEKPKTKKVLIKEEITVYSDTLLIHLYDGSIIDGDTVSVTYNDIKIAERQLLTADPSAIKLVLSKSEITHLLVLHAENLGSIPPNTGVMVIFDGEKRHEVHFTNSLELSTGVIFRKGAR